MPPAAAVHIGTSVTCVAAAQGTISSHIVASTLYVGTAGSPGTAQSWTFDTEAMAKARGAGGLENGVMIPLPTKRASVTLPHGVTDIKCIAESALVVVACTDGSVSLFNTATAANWTQTRTWGDLHKFATGKPAPTTALAIQPSTGNISSVGEDGHMHVLHVEEDAPIASKKIDSLPIVKLAYFGTNVLAALSTGGQLKLWDQRQQQPVIVTDSWIKSPQKLTSLASHPAQADIFATGSKNGSVQTWDRRNLSGPTSQVGGVHSSAVNDLKYHPTAPEYIVSGGADGRAARVDLAMQTSVSYDNVFESTLPVNSVDVLPAIDTLVAGTDSGTLLFRSNLSL